MGYTIRRRTKEDCEGIAKVVTTAWNETYKGIVPEWFLEELKTNEEERSNKTINVFDNNDNHQFVLEVDGKVVGFVNCGVSGDKDLKKCGEIFALYIIKKFKGKGYGRKLVEEATKELKSLGCDKMIIACLKGNPTNSFYEHIGGTYIKDGIYKRLNLPENIYFYESI